MSEPYFFLYKVTIKQTSVGTSQIGYYQADVCWQISNRLLSSRCLLENLKYYQADDVTSHKRLSYLERLCFAIQLCRIVFGSDSSSVLVGDRDFPGSNPTL